MNKVQKIQLDRLKLCDFNSMDGTEVAKLLVKHRHLWKAFVFGRFHCNQLIELRDMARDILNADELMILTNEESVRKLAALFRKLGADEIGWISQNRMTTGYFFGDYSSFVQAFGTGNGSPNSTSAPSIP